MKKELLNCMNWIVNKLSEQYVYNLDDTFNKEWNEFYKAIKEYIDFSNLTADEAMELGFGKWDDETNLYLFPLYLVPIIPEGLEVTDIGGQTFKYCKETADNDIRLGRVAYGIVIKEPKGE